MLLQQLTFVYSMTLTGIIVVGQFTSTPDDVSACVGTDVTLDWRYDHEESLDQAVWTRNGNTTSPIMLKDGSNPASPGTGITNIQHVANGAIKITGVSLQDGGEYTLKIYYTLSSRLPTVPADNVDVTVLDPPFVPTSSVTVSNQQSTYHCEVSSRGTPAADVRIKIGGILQASSRSVVDFTKRVDCCVVGEASRCIPENTNKLTGYCVNAITPSGPDSMQLSPNTTTYTLNVGERLGQVVCSAICVPTCTFSWTKGTSPITNSATLSRIIQDKNDGGIYTCTATRGTSVTDKRNITVNVRYGPESASFNPAGPIFTENEDTSLSVQCTSDCYPGCTYSWKKAGKTQTVISLSTLSFNPLKRDNAGQYICTISNTNAGVTSTASATATVVVRYGPDPVSFSPAGPSFIRIEGEQLTVRCITSCYPGCSYTWTKQGQVGSVSTTDSLYLSNVQTRHAGSYTCTVRNTYNGNTATQSGTVTLNVRYGPNSVSFSPANPLYIKNEGDQLTVRCISSCYPGCSYTWTKQGQSGSVSTTDRLYISDIRTNYAGNYTCTVRNTYSGITATLTGTVTLNVRYGPDIVSLTPNNTSYTIDENGALDDIICNADCYPACTYVWTKQGEGPPESTTARLSLGSRIPKSSRGFYTCTATNSGRNYQGTVNVTIHVRYGPDQAILTPSQATHTVNVGTTFQDISCTSDCYPACKRTWHKQKSASIIATTNGLLQLGELDKTEAGVYICSVTNVQLSQTKTAQFTLHIRYGPDNIILQPDNASHSRIEGNVLPDISCSSECYPGCSETWWNVTGNTQLGNGNVLSLGTVYRSYTGGYNCSSTNQAWQFIKSFSRSIYLTVQYFPDVSIYKVGNSETSELDPTLTIECTAQGEPDATFYDITHLAPNGVKVRDLSGNKGTEKMTVNLSNISFMDSGFYVCTVSNGIENNITHALNATDVLNLVVKGKPYISEPNKTIIDVAVGSNLTVNVSFYSNDGSEPGVRWFSIINDSQSEVNNSAEERYRISTFDDDVPVSYYGINIMEQGNTTQLIIDNVDVDDFRAYKVIINNTVGVVYHTVSVAPRGPPEKPYNFAAVDESKTTYSITLTWFSGFHGGADQTFHIMYKTDTSQWQEWSPVFGGKQSHVQFSETISHLDQGTFYSFMIYANNTFGPSYKSSAIHAKTNAVPDSEEPSITAAAVGGGVGGAIVILAVIFGVVFVRRRSSNKDSKDDVKKLSSDHNRNKENDDDVEVANPMYESAGDLPTTSNNNLYAVVDKSKKGSSKPAPEDKNLYAVVKKPKKKEEKVQQSELYSLPVKKSKDTPNKREKPKKEKGKQKQKKKGKPEDSKDGLVYETATSMSNPTKDSENVYENPSCSTVDEEAKPKSPSRTQNPDGLIYLEVEVPKSSNNADRRLIIHGLEDRNDYADIAFGKVGEPAPESDEEPEKKE